VTVSRWTDSRLALRVPLAPVVAGDGFDVVGRRGHGGEDTGCRTEYLYNMLPADAVIRERLFIGSDGPRTVLPSGRHWWWSVTRSDRGPHDRHPRPHTATIHPPGHLQSMCPHCWTWCRWACRHP